MTTRRGVWTWLAILGFSATVAFARPGVVKTRDGQTYDGDVDDHDPEALVVNVRGIKTRIERSRVASVQYAGQNQMSFSDRLAHLASNDVAGRLALAREAFNARDYLTARTAVDQAQQIDPNNADAAAFAETIRSQMRLEQSKAKSTQPLAAAGGATSEPSTEPSGSDKVLSAQDINTIRQLEMRPDDTGMRIRFDRDVKKRYLTFSGLTNAQFNSMTPIQQAMTIIQKGTPEMRRDVQILNDPPALFQYRRQVQPLVLQNCATSGCHNDRGGGKNFYLVQPAESDAATYTNFYILDKYTKATRSTDKSVFGHGDLRMIDRQNPEASLLVQFAMPGAMADNPHPDVPNYKPVFHGKNDPHLTMVNNWIGRALQPVDPDYGIDFPVPGMPPPSATSQPATAPAPVPPPPPPTRPQPHPPTPRPMTAPPPPSSPHGL